MGPGGPRLAAEAPYRDALVESRSWHLKVKRPRFESPIDFTAAFAGMAKSAQGRQTDAEFDVRRDSTSRPATARPAASVTREKADALSRS